MVTAPMVWSIMPPFRQPSSLVVSSYRIVAMDMPSFRVALLSIIQASTTPEQGICIGYLPSHRAPPLTFRLLP
jgi:hypothetical protein